MLAELRKIQLIEEGHRPESNMDQELLEFFTRRMGDGSMLEWVGVDGEQIVATGGIIFYDLPPTFKNKSGIRGYLCNVYTDPAYRKQGVASTMIAKLVEEAKNRGVLQLWIGASAMGKPLYLKLGFRDTGTWLEQNLY